MATTIPTYTGTIPDRDQSQSAFDTNVQDFLDYFGGTDPTDVIPKINTSAAEVEVNTNNALLYKTGAQTAAVEAAASANAALWLVGTAYDEGDTVIDDIDYQAYRCTTDSTTGVQPSTDTTGKWILVSGGAINNNLLINTKFKINQEGYAADGVSTLASGAYGHDGWKNRGNVSIIYTKESNGDITLNEVQNLFNPFSSSGNITQINDDIDAEEGEILTLSVEIVSLDESCSLVTGGGSPSSKSITTAGKHYVTYTAPAPNAAGIGISASAEASTNATPNIRFRNLKLEKGYAATKYVDPEPREEEKRCYYYYNKISPSSANLSFGYGIGVNLFIPLVGKINSTGLSINTSGSAPNVYDAAGTSYPVTGLAVTSVENNGIFATATVTGGPPTLPTVLVTSATTEIELDART